MSKICIECAFFDECGKEPYADDDVCKDFKIESNSRQHDAGKVK